MTVLRFFSLFIASLLLSVTGAGAQDVDAFLQSNDKIYIPVLVLATIFAGIVIFLIYLDRKVRRIEKDRNAG